MMLTRFWYSPEWHAYERATHEAPGTRAALLESATWSTRVLDLRPPEDVLWAGVRGSYHSLVNRLERDDAFSILEALPMDVLNVAMPLHRLVAGRQTRSEASWRLQASWVLAGHARCWIARRAGTPVGFLYALTTPPSSYYFSAAKTEDHVGHALQWHAIVQLKRAGVRWYELGWQGEAQDEKGRNIEFARRAWGGTDVRLCDVYGRALDDGHVSDADAVARAGGHSARALADEKQGAGPPLADR